MYSWSGAVATPEPGGSVRSSLYEKGPEHAYARRADCSTGGGRGTLSWLASCFHACMQHRLTADVTRNIRSETPAWWAGVGCVGHPFVHDERPSLSAPHLENQGTRMGSGLSGGPWSEPGSGDARLLATGGRSILAICRGSAADPLRPSTTMVWSGRRGGRSDRPVGDFARTDPRSRGHTKGSGLDRPPAATATAPSR